MPGNSNSGRKVKYKKEMKQIHFQMDIDNIAKLNTLAEKYTKNNRNDLIVSILERFIKSESQ